jgi:phosphocarrier protein
MVEQTVTIQNRAGIHARPSAMLVQAAMEFRSNIYFEKGDDRINGKSIMGILTLGASFGSEIRIIAEGEDEQKALETMVTIINNKFEEE